MYSLILATLGTRIPELERLLNSLLKQKGVELELIVVAQDNFSKVEDVLNDFNEKINIKLIKIEKKGLSRARNVGLDHIEGDVAVFTDDDCWYPPNIFEEIKVKIEKAQICTFQIYDVEKNELYKKYPADKIKHRSVLKSFKVSSIEIFINMKAIDRKDIYFDEEFGLGSKYPSGEENNLLLDLIKKKYQINYYPEVVVYHQITEKVFNQRDLFVKGVFFRRNFNLASSIFLGTGFYLKKRHLVDNKIPSLVSVYKGSFSYNKK